MVKKKENTIRATGSRPKKTVKKTPSAKKKIPKNIIQSENLISGFSAALLEMIEQRKLLEETYSSVIKNANLGFMIINLLEHSIIDVNDEYCRMSGYSREELIGKKTWEIDASMNRDKIKREGELAIEEGSIHLLTTHKRKDGTLFDVEVSSNLFAKKDNIVYSFVRDITELNQNRKEQEERLKFEKVISEFSTALINIKPDDIKNELEKWLEKIVRLMAVDRCAVNEYADDQQIIRNLIQYSVPEVYIPIPDVRKTPEGEIIE